MKIFSGICSQNFDTPSASGYMGDFFFQEFGPRILICHQLVVTWVQHIFRNLVPNFDMPSASGYMGEKYFQEFGPRFFDMSSASGYMGAKYFQEFGPNFLWVKNIFRNLVPTF